ncbi:MAG TPA: ComEC/Rec2 family competence protein, partial [Pseudomonadales bacterium]
MLPIFCLFSLAVICTLQFPPLNQPVLAAYVVVFLLAALLAWRHAPLRLPLLAALAGVLYCHTLAMQRIGAVLPIEREQQDLALVVDIIGLPVDRGRYWRSEARVVGDDGGQRLQLSWYGEAVPGPCQRWQITARLKRPHGLANPGAFDYAGYLLERGITARGYVREAVLLSQHNNCLADLRQRWH